MCYQEFNVIRAVAIKVYNQAFFWAIQTKKHIPNVSLETGERRFVTHEWTKSVYVVQGRDF